MNLTGAWTLIALAILHGGVADGQENKAKVIQDNSFFIEEAYNQDSGVVQHILNVQRMKNSRDWSCNFTEEWPIYGQKHQISYSVPYQTVNEGGETRRGFGDVSLHYRYQLFGGGEAAVAMAPRFTCILPTGNERQGRGNGALGFQGGIPLSVALREGLMTHVNLGSTYIPGAKSAEGDKADLTGWNFGQSLVWSPKPWMNCLLECVYSTQEKITGPGQKENVASALVSPGLSWALNFKSGLQIVSGLAAPIGIGPSKGERSLFFYLSFEHPFKK